MGSYAFSSRVLLLSWYHFGLTGTDDMIRYIIMIWYGMVWYDMI